jgi:hypothetical protein
LASEKIKAMIPSPTALLTESGVIEMKTPAFVAAPVSTLS